MRTRHGVPRAINHYCHLALLYEDIKTPALNPRYAFAAGKVIFSSHSFVLLYRYNVHIDKVFRDIKNHDDNFLYLIPNEPQRNFVAAFVKHYILREDRCSPSFFHSVKEFFSSSFLSRYSNFFLKYPDMKYIRELNPSPSPSQKNSAIPDCYRYPAVGHRFQIFRTTEFESEDDIGGRVVPSRGCTVSA